MTSYAFPVDVHPDRYGAVKTNANRLFVLHTSEQTSETDKSAEALAKYMESPGDRPNGSGGVYGSSYHYVVDTDQIIPCVNETVVAYSAAGANHDGIHICFPGRAGQTRTQWLDPVSRAMIRQCAELLVDRSPHTGIPLRDLYDSEVRAGMSGVVDHGCISRVYKRSTHTDVGPAFPWDVLWKDVATLTTPPIPDPEDEDDMQTIITRWGTEPYLIEVGHPKPGEVRRPWRGIPDEQAAALIAAGVARDCRDTTMPVSLRVTAVEVPQPATWYRVG
jgi:hypothetical protein